MTAELVFTIYMLANEKHKATFMAPIGIGLALFIAEMIGVYYTGGSLNRHPSIELLFKPRKRALEALKLLLGAWRKCSKNLP